MLVSEWLLGSLVENSRTEDHASSSTGGLLDFLCTDLLNLSISALWAGGLASLRICARRSSKGVLALGPDS